MPTPLSSVDLHEVRQVFFFSLSFPKAISWFFFLRVRDSHGFSIAAVYICRRRSSFRSSAVTFRALFYTIPNRFSEAINVTFLFRLIAFYFFFHGGSACIPMGRGAGTVSQWLHAAGRLYVHTFLFLRPSKMLKVSRRALRIKSLETPGLRDAKPIQQNWFKQGLRDCKKKKCTSC